MKRQALAVLLTLCALLCVWGCAATGCGTQGTQPAPLFFTDGTFCAKIDATFGTQAVSFTLLRDAEGTLRITYTAPQSVANLSYRMDTEGVSSFAQLEDCKIPLTKESLPRAIRALCALFALRQEDLRECKAKKGADTVAQFVCDAGEVTLTLSSADGLPNTAQGTLCGLAFSLTFCERAKGESL